MPIKKFLDNFNALKEIVDTVKKNKELQKIIVNLEEQVLELRKENSNLKEQLSKKQEFNMEFKRNVYWNIKTDGKEEGPYCSSCYDKNKEAIRLHDLGDCYSCHICKYHAAKGGNINSRQDIPNDNFWGN